MVIHMIAIGGIGTLPAMLDKIAEFFEEDVETASKQLTRCSSHNTITIGVLVGGMLIALSAMFSAVINSGLQ